MSSYATPLEFADLWDALGCRGSHLPIFELLASCYREPPRAYHTLEHIGWGLKRIDEIVATEPSCNVKAVKWAMWFHDARMNFDDDRDLDELDSATMAKGQAISAMLAPAFALKVQALVLATAHTEAAKNIDEAVLVDADLSILAAPTSAFDAYEAQVRTEWGHVSDEAFRAGRIAVLERINGARQIYTTPYAYNQWERRARFNLGTSLAKLKASAAGGGKP